MRIPGLHRLPTPQAKSWPNGGRRFRWIGQPSGIRLLFYKIPVRMHPHVDQEERSSLSRMPPTATHVPYFPCAAEKDRCEASYEVSSEEVPSFFPGLYDPCGDPDGGTVFREVFRDDRPRADDGPVADADAGDDIRSHAQEGTLSDRDAAPED